MAAESWVGRPAAEMRQAWGAPAKIVDVRATDGAPGSPVLVMVWEDEDTSAPESGALSTAQLSQSSIGGDCSRPSSQWEGVPSTCRQDPLQTYYNQGYRSARRHCKVIATVVDSLIVSVQVENRMCHFTDDEFARFSKPGTPLPE